MENVALPNLNRTKLLRERAYEALRDNILDGSLPAGLRLIERDLAESLSVSRTPVREAMQRLEIEGLVVACAGRGYEVAPIDLYDIEEALELRLLLETHAAEKAAALVTAEQLSDLKEICQQEQIMLRQDLTESLGRLQALNNRFHDHLIACAGSDLLSSTVKFIKSQPAYRLYALGDAENLKLFAESHCRLVSALQAREAEAAKNEVAYHLGLARDILMTYRSGTSSE